MFAGQRGIAGTRNSSRKPRVVKRIGGCPSRIVDQSGALAVLCETLGDKEESSS